MSQIYAFAEKQSNILRKFAENKGAFLRIGGVATDFSWV
jgi:hypothetical protein